MSRACFSCCWWDPSTVDGKDDLLSPCRAQPPVLPVNHSQGVWPMVSADDWCGFHRAKVASPTEPGANHDPANPYCACADCIPF